LSVASSRNCAASSGFSWWERAGERWNQPPPRRLARDNQPFGGVMGNDKSILEKIADTVKDIANIASEAADHALKAEEPPLRADERAAVTTPLAAEGLVSDPMMVPPIAVSPAPRRRRAAPKRTAKKAAKKTAKKAAKKLSGRQRRDLQRRGQTRPPKRARRKPTKRWQRKRAEEGALNSAAIIFLTPETSTHPPSSVETSAAAMCSPRYSR